MKLKLTKEEYEVEAILNDRRKRRLNKRTKKFKYYTEYLTKWKNCNEITWEKEKTLCKCQTLISKYLIEKEQKEKAKNENEGKNSKFISKTPKKLKTSKKIIFNVEKIESKNNGKVEMNKNINIVNSADLIPPIGTISNEPINLNNNIFSAKNQHEFQDKYDKNESSDEVDSNQKTEATPLKLKTLLNKKRNKSRNKSDDGILESKTKTNKTIKRKKSYLKKDKSVNSKSGCRKKNFRNKSYSDKSENIRSFKTKKFRYKLKIKQKPKNTRKMKNKKSADKKNYEIIISEDREKMKNNIKNTAPYNFSDNFTFYMKTLNQ